MVEKSNSFLDDLKSNLKSEKTTENLQKEVIDFYELVTDEWAESRLADIKNSATLQAKAGNVTDQDGKKTICGKIPFYTCLTTQNRDLLDRINKKLTEANREKIEISFPLIVHTNHQVHYKRFIGIPYKEITQDDYIFSFNELGMICMKKLIEKATADKIKLTEVEAIFPAPKNIKSLHVKRMHTNSYYDYIIKSSGLLTEPIVVSKISETNTLTSSGIGYWSPENVVNLQEDFDTHSYISYSIDL